MSTLQMKTDNNPKSQKIDLSLEKAIKDTRKQENLHGPFSSAKEAITSMLEDLSCTTTQSCS